MALAGDVNVSFNAAGDLTLTGDKGSNQVEVIGNGDGTVTVRGLNATTIHFNGTLDSDAEVIIDQPLHDLTVQLGKGNDTFSLRDATINGATNIDAGAGSDQITLGDASGVLTTTFLGDTNITLGGGHDLLRIGGALSAPAGVGVTSLTTFTNLTVDGGNGDDCVVATGAAVTGDLGIHTGNGNDLIYLTDLVVTGNLAAQTGNGKDVIQVGGPLGTVFGAVGGQGVFVGGTTSIDTGNGKDLVAIEGLTTFQGLVQVNTGNGPDQVAVVDDAVFNANLEVNGGRGPNRLMLDDTSVVFNVPAALDASRVVRVAASDLANAVANLNDEILERAEACLFGPHGNGHDSANSSQQGKGNNGDHGHGKGQGKGND